MGLVNKLLGSLIIFQTSILGHALFFQKGVEYDSYGQRVYCAEEQQNLGDSLLFNVEALGISMSGYAINEIKDSLKRRKLFS